MLTHAWRTWLLELGIYDLRYLFKTVTNYKLETVVHTMLESALFMLAFNFNVQIKLSLYFYYNHALEANDKVKTVWILI